MYNFIVNVPRLAAYDLTFQIGCAAGLLFVIIMKSMKYLPRLFHTLHLVSLFAKS